MVRWKWFAENPEVFMLACCTEPTTAIDFLAEVIQKGSSFDGSWSLLEFTFKGNSRWPRNFI